MPGIISIINAYYAKELDTLPGANNIETTPAYNFN
jgi:hypothetical protein